MLYSLAVKLNLISISKLCKSLSYFIQFSYDSCIIQDLNTKKMIGFGETLNGLYRLVMNTDSSSSSSFPCFNKDTSTVCNNVSKSDSIVIPSSTLWHFTLGNLSPQILSHRQSMYPSISCNNKDLGAATVQSENLIFLKKLILILMFDSFLNC